MRGDGDGWVVGTDGERHWGKHGAAGLLLRAPDRGGRPMVLLQHRAKWSHQGGTWALPGGARDSHETTVHAAVREAHEEAGIPAEDIGVRATRVTAGQSEVWTYTTVVADAQAPLATQANAESVELRWVGEGEVLTMPLHPAFALAWPGLQVREVTLLLDTANVLGARPDGWWRDRAGATDALLREVGALFPRTVELSDGGFGWVSRVTAVLEGAARAASPGPGAVVACRAPGSGDDTLVELAEERDEAATIVVTADRGLRGRLRPGTTTLSPSTLLGWLNASA